jgi:hypothetical protein
MNALNLNLVLKGGRNYVHGTTMFDETVRLLSDLGYEQLNSVEFLIHKMTCTNLTLVVEPHHDTPSTIDDIALMRFFVNGQLMQACIKSQEGVPEIRIPYDESVIKNRCEINSSHRSIQILNSSFDFSQIEVIVSMNKALHLAVLDKPSDASWVFCRWDSQVWPLPSDLSGVTVILKQALGTRLTRADVELSGNMLGHIYFSAKVAP